MVEVKSDDLWKYVREDVKIEVNKIKKKCILGIYVVFF